MKSMKQDFFFTYLPSEIITEILARLPIHTILTCKCVCKSWRDLLDTHEFAKFHLFKSLPGIAYTSKVYEMGIRHTNHDYTITKLNFIGYRSIIFDSVDGLLLLARTVEEEKEVEIILCNPITCEYIDLHYVEPLEMSVFLFGFGKCKITGQYKVIAICEDETYQTWCEVYTVGTGSWRSVAPHTLLTYKHSYQGTFVNGNLYYLAYDSNETQWVSCFDLETKHFNVFSSPYRENSEMDFLVASEDSLYLCDYKYDNDTCIIIWLMKEHGVEKSWTKEFVIKDLPDLKSPLPHPVQVFKDGVILNERSSKLLLHSTKNKTTQNIYSFEGCDPVNAVFHTPSLLSLKCFGADKSISF